ncbi:MAG: PQQ-binding-like beta-propeller repeat protein, partial [Thermoguttaceae bacterium]
YGIMPANGMLYAPMHNCACQADMKLCGFNALAAPTSRVSSRVDVTRHQRTKGPAFGSVEGPARESPGDWPTYRHDAARSGVASCAAPESLETVWEADVGGKPSAPVTAGGRMYVAAVDQHTLHVLDEATGRELWTFTAEGRIDSPPTIYRGTVLFGSRDGSVYCLRAADGEVVWRFRAVAEDRRLMAREQIESVWPVHGSILIRDGEAWFVAGRSEFLDGGLQIVRLKPETGEVLSRATFDGKAPGGGILTGAEEKRLVGLPDVLSASGDRIFMRAGVIRLEGDTITKKLLPEESVIRYGLRGRTEGNKIPREAHPHLFSSYGFLDDSWMHRSYWVFHDTYGHRHSYFQTGQTRPAGRILVCDEDNVYGFGRQQRYFNWTTPMEYRLFARTKAGNWEQALIWSRNAPGLLARGLVLAGDTLFAAGPPDVLDETQPGIRMEDAQTRKKMEKQDEALAGLHGGILMALSRDAGELKHQLDLDAPPVFDGMIVANGRLFIAMENGKVQCRGKAAGKRE